MKLLILFISLSMLVFSATAVTWHMLGKNRAIYIDSGGQNVNYAAAVSACEAINATLVRVKNARTQTFLEDKIKETKAPPDSFYVGLIRTGPKQNDFKWNDATHITSGETQWYPTYGEPNNARGDENCATMQRDLNWKWNDVPCSSKSSYICERHVEITANGFSVQAIYSSESSKILDIIYKMCLSSAPYKPEASARTLDEKLPHRFSVYTLYAGAYLFRIRLERIDLNKGWVTTDIKIAWKAYFNTPVKIY